MVDSLDRKVLRDGFVVKDDSNLGEVKKVIYSIQEGFESVCNGDVGYNPR